MDPRSDQTFTVSAGRNHGDIESSTKKIASYLTKQGIHTDLVSSMELSVYEALVNIYDHEPENFRDSPIQVECSLSGGLVTVTIRYEGDYFDMTSTKLPDIVEHFKKGKTRGLGIYFIRTLMDSVEYSHDHGKNTLILTKKEE